MNAKFSLALIALVGIGVFALPSTMSLFAGQHSFYNIDATGNQIPCQKCHGDVKAELSANANTNPAVGPLTPGPHAAFKCEYCHRIEQGQASGDNAFGQVTYVVGGHGVPGGNRVLAITLQDMEAGNFPASITVGDTAATIVTLPTISGLPMGKFSLSGCANTDGGTVCSNPANVLPNTPPDRRSVATYKTDGTPKDTIPATQDGGLNVTAITWSASNAPDLNNSGSKAVNPGSAYHAASLVSCMECHGGEEPMGHYSRVADASYGGRPCSDCHYGGGGAVPGGTRWTALQAGGFNLTGLVSDTGATEAHNKWVKTDDGINRFGGPNGKANNGACIACHTHVAVDINFQKGYKLAFDAIEQSNGQYDVSNTAVEGTVKIAVYGNSEGTTFATSNKTYNWGGSPEPLYINGTGAQVIGLSNDTSDNATALTT